MRHTANFSAISSRASPGGRSISIVRHTTNSSAKRISQACSGEPIGSRCAAVLYTVVIGRQDSILPPLKGFPAECAIVVTDEASNARNGWRLHRITCLDQIGTPSELHPRMVSRWWKINSMRFFSMPTMYIDAKEPYNASTWPRTYSNIHEEVLTACNATFAAFEHPKRPNQLVEELEAILEQHRTQTAHACARHLSRTRSNSALRSSARVVHGSFLVRQPSRQLATLESAWWDAYTKGCDRDQPALAQALFRLYGNQSHTCGHDVHILAHDGRHHQRWSDATKFCHPLAHTCA